MAGLSRASAWMSVSGVFPSPSRFSARPSSPAYFGQNEKEATRKAGEYANLDVISILPEPTAAALAYVNGMKSGERIDVEMDRNDGFNETAESVRKAAEDAAEFDVFLG